MSIEDTSRTPLHGAISNKDYITAIRIIEEEIVDVNALDSKHNTAMVYFLRRIRNRKTVISYIEIRTYIAFMNHSKIDFEIVSETGRSIRSYVIEMNMFELYSILFSHHKWMYEDLFLSMRYNNKEVFQFLLDYFIHSKFPLDEFDDIDRTPFEVAIECDDIYYFEALCKVHAPLSRMAIFRIMMRKKQEHITLIRQYYDGSTNDEDLFAYATVNVEDLDFDFNLDLEQVEPKQAVIELYE
jgi:hypothetical protein